jgi:hypothetical protein
VCGRVARPKNILDRIVETDPGGFKVETSPQYLKDPPERIAVLPFADVGSANFVVDKVALTHRSKIERANWAWTDSQRLRRSLDGYLAQREFIVSPLDGVDSEWFLPVWYVDAGRDGKVARDVGDDVYLGG